MTTDPNEIKRLSVALLMAKRAYTNGRPIMTDQEFDLLWADLFAIDPQNKALYHTSQSPSGNTTLHVWPIPGQQKAMNEKDLHPFLFRFKDQPLVVEPKYDGVAAVLYQNPSGQSLILFGDGLQGRDITHHMPNITFPDIPLSKVCPGELVIPRRWWDSSYGKNPRNTVSGWIDRKEIPVRNVVHFVPHENGMMQKPIQVANRSLEDVQQELLAIYADYIQVVPADGLMIKVSDPAHRLIAGHTSFYHWSIAWKPPMQTARTKVVDIHWNVSRSGKVIPTVEYSPVDLCGTTNSFATGNNAKHIYDMKISIGSTITVGKAGEIIPMIIRCDKPFQPIAHLPDNCPSCGMPLAWDSVHLICQNTECFASLVQRINYFYTKDAMKINGIGHAFIERLLLDTEIRILLSDYPWALLCPDHWNLIPKMNSILGDGVVSTYLDGLQEAQRTRDPSYFLAGLGLPQLGRKYALGLWQAIKFGISPDRKAQIAVNNFALALYKWQQAEPIVTQYFEFLPLPQPPKLFYCITGTLSVPREDMITYLQKYRWEFKSTITKNTSYLILGNLTKESRKLKDAKRMNVEIIAEHNLHQILKKEIPNDPEERDGLEGESQNDNRD